MSNGSFERLSILVVEDNIYIRDIMENVLRNLGFGWVASARDGKEAVEFLTMVKNNPSRAGVMCVDIILSDLVMSPINGLLLLQWLRSSKDSPNRMLPFVMISGAADNQHVKAARDVGVTEFCAKPFSAKVLMDKLVEVIEYPRQFVATTNYFGPDRRRKKFGVPTGEQEKRAFDESSATIVYSADNIKKPKKETEVWYFRLPNSLKEKAGGLSKGPIQIPENLLEEAEKQLARSAMDFADWAMTYLSKLGQLAADALMRPSNRKAYFVEINLVALELRGQGGTFGYPLITIFAKSLYEATQPGCKETDAALELVKSHIDAMRAVIRDRVAGDGGEIGKALLKGFQAAITKYKNEAQIVR